MSCPSSHHILFSDRSIPSINNYRYRRPLSRLNHISSQHQPHSQGNHEARIACQTRPPSHSRQQPQPQRNRNATSPGPPRPRSYLCGIVQILAWALVAVCPCPCPCPRPLKHDPYASTYNTAIRTAHECTHLLDPRRHASSHMDPTTFLPTLLPTLPAAAALLSVRLWPVPGQQRAASSSWPAAVPHRDSCRALFVFGCQHNKTALLSTLDCLLAHAPA